MMHSATFMVFLALWLGVCHGGVLRNTTRSDGGKAFNQTQQHAPAATTYHYWIDQSCFALTSPHTNHFFDDSLEAMFAMACGAADSLAPDPVLDDDFARNFKLLFSTRIDDKTLYPQSPLWRVRFGTRPDPGLKVPKKMVYDTLNSICQDWHETSDRASSNLRIYCRDDNYVDQVGGGRWDALNGISANARCSGGSNTVAFVGRVAAIGKDWDSENVNRATLTICDAALQNGMTFQSLDPKADLQMSHGVRTTVDTYRPSLPTTLLHEWTHVFPYLLYDAARLKSYGWENCRKMSTKKSLINSDSYALLGLTALLARRRQQDLSDPSTWAGGYTTQRLNPVASPQEQLQTVKNNRDGLLFFYPDITTPGNPRGKNA